MFAAGIFLMLKKEIAWIQPPSQKGVAASQLPAITYEQILETSRAHPEAGIAVWSDIDRIDVRPSKGIAKVQSKTGWEIQIDTANAKALSAIGISRQRGIYGPLCSFSIRKRRVRRRHWYAAIDVRQR